MSTDQPSSNNPLNDFTGQHKPKLLLVEDSEINQLLAIDMLEEIGMIVDVAADGKRAIDKVQQTDYDAVLMDIEMPIMGGLEACQHIRQLGGKYATLPIIAVTAHDDAEYRAKSATAGMSHHLTKPLDADQVRQALFKITKQER